MDQDWKFEIEDYTAPISSQFKHQIFKYNPLTSSSKKSTAASSSAAFFREVFRKWKSNWICWNPLRLNVWSRANSCKLFKQSLTIVVITDSCKIKVMIFLLFSHLKCSLLNNHKKAQTCVCSTLVKISIFCLNNFARWVSRSWLLAFWVFDRLNLSSLSGLLREEVVLPLLSVRRCFLLSPSGNICFTSFPIASNYQWNLFSKKG